MKTSYFAKHNRVNFERAVSISRSYPKGFTGWCYRQLAPSWDILCEYRRTGDVETYTKRYKEEVLSKLNPQEVWDDLKENATLLCWEGSDKFCHRHLVAEWFKEKLNKSIKEVT
jgi:uncharacterized protein YeaO (DUF488 family)